MIKSYFATNFLQKLTESWWTATGRNYKILSEKEELYE